MLRVDLEDFEGNTRDAEYNMSDVMSENGKYKVILGSYSDNSVLSNVSYFCSYLFPKVWVLALAGSWEDTSFSQLRVSLSIQEYEWVPANCRGNLAKCWEVTCDGLASRPGGVATLLVA